MKVNGMGVFIEIIYSGKVGNEYFIDKKAGRGLLVFLINKMI